MGNKYRRVNRDTLEILAYGTRVQVEVDRDAGLLVAVIDGIEYVADLDDAPMWGVA